MFHAYHSPLHLRKEPFPPYTVPRLRAQGTMLPTPEIPPIPESVYEPAEDSFLLLDCMELCLPELRHRKFPVVCEIGSGSGIVSTFLKVNIFPNGLFLATDFNPRACEATFATAQANCTLRKFNSLEVLQMSLNLGIRPSTIDVLVFNPPYVPAETVPVVPSTKDDDAWLDLALLGGKDGMEATWAVLLNLERILSPDGVAYILFCARNNPDNVVELMQKRGWATRTIEKRKAGWEVLSVTEFKKITKKSG